MDEQGGLTAEAAIEALNGRDEGAEPEETGVEADVEDDDRGGDVEAEEEPGPAISPPHSWDAEARARFAELPPELQAYTLQREQQRDAAVGQASERAAQAERAASIIDQFGQVLDQLVPRAKAVFGDRWNAVDWAGLANSDPGEYWRLRALRDEEQGELQRLNTAQQAAFEHQQQRFLANREQQLPYTAPELCDPRNGLQHRTELSTYLSDAGIPAELVGQADAAMIGIAWKALQFDRATARARASVNGQQRSALSARPVPPAASPQRGSLKQQKAGKAFARLRSSGSVDDAVAFLNAQD